MVIGKIKNQQVGIVGFGIENDVAEVSIYFKSRGWFGGQDSNLLLNAEEWLNARRPEIKSLRASVLTKNDASKNLFLASITMKIRLIIKKILEIKNDYHQ